MLIKEQSSNMIAKSNINSLDPTKNQIKGNRCPNNLLKCRNF